MRVEKHLGYVGFVAGLTFERLFAGVNAQMDFQFSIIDEGFAAVFADLKLIYDCNVMMEFTRNNSTTHKSPAIFVVIFLHVINVVGPSSKLEIAILALVQKLARVFHYMNFECWQRMKAFAAIVADVVFFKEGFFVNWVMS